MFRAAIIFFVVGLVAFLMGFWNLAGLSIEIGKVVLMVFLGLAIISALGGLVTGRNTKHLP